MLEGFEGFDPIEDDEHVALGADPERRVLLLVRKVSGMVSAAHIQAMFERSQAELGEPGEWSILFDTRAAIGRGGPEFEVEAKQLRDYMLEHYNRVAVVVRSALGEMQVQRYEDPAIRMLVFRSVERALAFLALHDRRAAG